MKQAFKQEAHIHQVAGSQAEMPPGPLDSSAAAFLQHLHLCPAQGLNITSFPFQKETKVTEGEDTLGT